jgi:Tfp pilus assembly protein PilX
MKISIQTIYDNLIGLVLLLVMALIVILGIVTYSSLNKNDLDQMSNQDRIEQNNVATKSLLSYTDARTDTNTTQLPAMPVWGNAGSKWCNPAFNNLCIVRLTDKTTVYPLSPAISSLQTADSGEPHLVSKDSKHVLVRTVGGSTIVLAFDKTNSTVSKTALTFNYTPQFSEVTSLLMYGLQGTKIHKISIKGDYSSVSDKVLFDFASDKCLGTSFKATWNGIVTIAGEPNPTFKTSFSDKGGQGSGQYAVAWSVKDGCVVYDTVNGTVTTKKGTSQVSTKDRFYIHEASPGRNPNYGLITYSAKGPNGTNGCIAGDCGNNSPYVWNIGTSVVPCGPYSCDGHIGKGFNTFVSGKKLLVHNYSDPSQPLIALANFPSTFPDKHISANNNADYLGSPYFLVSQQANSPSVYPSWGYDEVLAVASDGSKKTYRFNQTLNSGKSPLFICQNAIGVVSPLGDYVVITSDMGGQGALGYEEDGVTSRCDVFAVLTSLK